MKDLYHNIGIVNLLKAQTISGGESPVSDTASDILDLAGFDGAVIAVSVGALTGVDADSYLDIVLQESDTTTAASFSTVSAANMHGSFTRIDASTKDEVVQRVGYKGNKRYIRVLLDFTTGTGGITAAPVSIIGILGLPDSKPVTAPSPITAS